MSENVFGMSLEDDPAVEPSAPQDPQPEAPAATPDEPQPPQPDPQQTAAVPDDEEAEFLAGPGEDGVRLGNKVYRDWQGADHVFRQFQGRARAAEQRMKDALARAEKAEKLAEALAHRSPAQEQAVEPPAPTPAPRRIADAVTEDEIDALISEKGPAGALKAMLEIIEERVPAVVDERTQDVRRVAQKDQVVTMAERLFEAAAQSGEFPELVPDTPEAQAIIDIWSQQVLVNPNLSQLALTPDGVRIAVDRFRASRTSATPAPSVPAARLVAQVKAQASAQRDLSQMGTHAAARPQPGPTPTYSDLEEAARLAVASRRHEVFGFEAD